MIVTIDFLPNVSGVATLSYEQALGLADKGHEIRVVTTMAGAEDETGGDKFDIVQFTNTHPPVFRLLRFFNILRTAVKEWRPDYIWCSNYRGFGLPVMVIASRFQTPYGLYIHGTELTTENKSRLRHKIFKAVARSASAVAANSMFTSSLLQRLYGLSSTVVTPGVHQIDGTEEGFREEVSSIRRKWLAQKPSPISDDQRLIFYSTSRISRQKGIDLVLKSITLLDPAIRERILYVIGGYGPEEVEFRNLAERLGINEYVIFNGKAAREDLPKLVRAADVYLQPSQPAEGFLEGFGISFMEAQMAGVPCIASDWCGIPEAVRPGVTALLVPTGSADNIAEAITRVSTDSQWRKTASTEAITWAQANTWAEHAQKLHHLIAHS